MPILHYCDLTGISRDVPELLRHKKRENRTGLVHHMSVEYLTDMYFYTDMVHKKCVGIHTMQLYCT